MIPEDFKLCTRPAKYKCRFVNPEDKDFWLVVWTIDDVKAKAEEDDIELTDEQARQILRYFEDHYQPVWEASWWVMEASINQVMERQKKEGVKSHA